MDWLIDRMAPRDPDGVPVYFPDSRKKPGFRLDSTESRRLLRRRYLRFALLFTTGVVLAPALSLWMQVRIARGNPVSVSAFQGAFAVVAPLVLGWVVGSERTFRRRLAEACTVVPPRWTSADAKALKQRRFLALVLLAIFAGYLYPRWRKWNAAANRAFQEEYRRTHSPAPAP
jgi:hypothetical protein